MIKDNIALEEFKKISGMTTRCYNVCVSAGIKTFGEFMDYIFTINCRNMGKNTLQEVISLKSRYKDLRMTDNECNIDWEQVRIKAAISALHGFSSNPHARCVDDDTETLARWSVGAADALISELKKGGNNE